MTLRTFGSLMPLAAICSLTISPRAVSKGSCWRFGSGAPEHLDGHGSAIRISQTNGERVIRSMACFLHTRVRTRALWLVLDPDYNAPDVHGSARTSPRASSRSPGCRRDRHLERHRR